jgi:Tfp pilus assembly protein PilO
MKLLQRVLLEKRSIIVPLLIALAVNIVAYVLVVRPLGIRSASAAQRAETARTALAAAERDRNAARDLVAGKTLAEQELSTFYDKVLPPNLSAARRMTYAPLPALARKTNVRYDASRSTIEQQADQSLGRLRISMVLEGEYDSVRQFIYELETAPPFVIIDDVTLAQTGSEGPLALSIELSAYYRTGPNGD